MDLLSTWPVRPLQRSSWPGCFKLAPQPLGVWINSERHPGGPRSVECGKTSSSQHPPILNGEATETAELDIPPCSVILCERVFYHS